MTPEAIELRRIWLDDDVPQQELADAIGIERSNLNKLLNNPKRRVQPRTLSKIQKFLASRRTDLRRRASRSK